MTDIPERLNVALAGSRILLRALGEGRRAVVCPEPCRRVSRPPDDRVAPRLTLDRQTPAMVRFDASGRIMVSQNLPQDIAQTETGAR